MLRPDDGVDLHLHTTVHDGRWTPAGLVHHAASRGIGCLAITDHDMTGGIAPARQAARELGVLVVPGVEVTATWQGGEYHVLVYGPGIDPPSPALAALLARIHESQLRRAEEWVTALGERGITLSSLPAVCRGREQMPVYVLGALIRDGHAADYKAVLALVRSLGATSTGAAPLEEIAPAAHAGGAVALLAHPGRNEHGFSTLLGDALEAMVHAGQLDGIEVFHPNHDAALQAHYLELARERRWLVSAGSDSHGPAHSRPPAPHPARLCRDLLERVLPSAGGPPRVTADVARAAL